MHISTLGSWLHMKLPQWPAFCLSYWQPPGPGTQTHPEEVITECYRLNVCVPLKFLCWSPCPYVMVFGNEVFGRLLGLDEVMRIGPHDGISALRRKGGESTVLSLSLCEHTGRRGCLRARKNVLTRNCTCQHLDLGLCSLRNCKK